MLQRGEERPEASSTQECQGIHGGRGKVMCPGDRGVSPDAEIKAWNIHSSHAH